MGYTRHAPLQFRQPSRPQLNLSDENFQITKARINKELRRLGISLWGLQKTETRYLPHLIHATEKLGGIVYGHSEAGSIMLIATDKRVIYLDKKPMYVKSEDISYDVVAGITLEWVALSGIIILHTRLADFRVRTMNRRAAEIFRDYVDDRCIEHQHNGTSL